MRSDVPETWDERATLLAMLGYVRATVRAKCEGLSDALARVAPLPTSPLTTISGLVSHLRWVERSWFETVYLGKPDDGPWTEDEPDREMTYRLDVPLTTLLAEYEAQAAHYDELVRTADLDSTAQKPIRTGRHVTLRWILLHLIEETARHNGHLDILREQADGVTGA
jgi:uncharacterized damage-inducible protein DinB